MDKKLETTLKEIRTNKNVSTFTNHRHETVGNQNTQSSGSKIDRFVGVRASNTENSDSENEDYPLTPSEMKYLRQHAKPFYEKIIDLDPTTKSNKD